MILTKISTGPKPEFFLFTNLAQEDDYFVEICGFCQSPECMDDCVIPFPISGHSCEGCEGQGRIKFLMQPADNGESYYVITQCGFCDGIGIV